MPRDVCFCPRSLRTDVAAVRLALPIVCLAGACWASPSDQDRRILIEDARLASGRLVDIAVVDGRIAEIGEIDAVDSDVIVRARGGDAVAGRRRRFDSAPVWSELVEGPATGVTSVVLPVAGIRRDWLEGVRERAAWIGPRLAGEADPPPAIERGIPAEILLLEPESRALSQAVVGDRVLRRADLETRREMIVSARRGLASLPLPEAGMRSMRLDAAGLPVGRVDVDADGRRIHERTVSPNPGDRVWEITSSQSGWTVVLRESGRILATIRRDGSEVLAERPDGERIRIPAADGPPSIDLAATLAAAGGSLLRLEVGGTAERPLVEITVSTEGLSVRPDRMSFRRVAPDASPLPVAPGEAAIEFSSPSGRRGLVVVGKDGFPSRAWETTPAGDIEWIGLPGAPLGGAGPGPESSPDATKRP